MAYIITKGIEMKKNQYGSYKTTIEVIDAFIDYNKKLFLCLNYLFSHHTAKACFFMNSCVILLIAITSPILLLTLEALSRKMCYQSFPL